MARRKHADAGSFRPGSESLEGRLVLTVGSASYVAAVYQNVLDRAATPQEVSYWTQQIQGGRPSADLASGLVNSAERRGEEITHNFEILLGRSPTRAEQSYYLNVSAAGSFSNNLLQSILDSPEYQGLHPGNTGYVDALYDDLLGRDADPAGQAFFLKVLNGDGGPAQVVAGILHSPERNGEVVDQVYSNILRRTDNPVEHQAQVDLLQFGGETTENLLVGALTSPEFIKRHGNTTG